MTTYVAFSTAWPLRKSNAIALSIAEKFGCSRATLRDWVNKQVIEDGERDGLTKSEREELKALQRENRELTANIAAE